MGFRNLEKLFSDSQYVTELLNNVCRPFATDGSSLTIMDGWIDDRASAALTASYERISAQDGLFFNTVKVIHAPERQWDAVGVEKSEDLNRYVLITVIPDVFLAAQMNFPFIQTMSIMSLITWENARAATAACRHSAEIRIVNEDIPPILNIAKLQWVSIYVGKEKYAGLKNMIGCYAEPDKESIDQNLNFYEARCMEPDPLLERLIAAYDADADETGTADTSGSDET